ncbi:MAG: ABC transporter ATP-binding protein [Micromonosporaceae bacterium]|nr:ABC transporter ATP-binding protein [Micromonosporaceae bacterium]
MTSDVILSFEDVRLAFAGVVAIDGVSFTVGRDELFAIIGPNGAGKTSIFNVLSGVYRPQRGRVVFDGKDILGRRPHQIAAAGLARTFQNVELFANLTVLDNLMLGLHTHLTYGTFSAIAWFGRARRQELAARAEVERIVDFLELEQWRRMPVGLLPYGVQKRVELGRALAMRPKLLLLDEPVAGMNLEETEDMARFILDIREELKIPMILVEHDMGLVMDLADRVMVVDFGRPVATGKPAEIQRHPEVLRAYLGEAARTGETSGTGEPSGTGEVIQTATVGNTATVGEGARGTDSGGGA